MKDNSINDSSNFRMVALDLDGTLLNSNHQLAEEQSQYLRNLHSKGFKVCIATGRAAPSVYGIVKKLAFPEPLPVVCSNGARGFLLSYNTDGTSSAVRKQNKCQEELFYVPVSRNAVTKTIQLAKKLGHFVQYYLDDGIYANPRTASHKRMIKEYEHLTDSHIVTVDDNFEQFLKLQQDDRLPSKLLVRCEKDEFSICHKSFIDLLYPTNDNTNNNDDDNDNDDDNNNCGRLAHIVAAFNNDLNWFLEILHPNVNKGHGLKNMCKKLDISLNEVVAMGDGTNDIEFLQMSGLGIAMNNAHESLIKVANYTTEWTNDEHGVIKALEDLRLKGKLLY
mmetsp:Transcript_24766/g.27723  ORF Transcript_24766/g.27723 Transcript_24766/m.27723 type:complete len:335 (-) Transcript_24766:2-1006(-)|eukprot:CAMPEP_0171004718 /NCGR_PEP_ID=MMETSP0736-20130129/17893_1 /TAXON_ID=186038 /ORGANISM="Fragilariopsis kerguelensis, Strain L26-C5" /LENGTH=334 /DNA_ID=CAMNT_0011434195 /DNA_START=74 /DNA_END=1078 /DNA_ORIENTATION=+